MMEWLLVLSLWSGSRYHILTTFDTEAECKIKLAEYKKEIKLGPSSKLDCLKADHD